MFVEIIADVRDYFEEREIDAEVAEGAAARNNQPDFGEYPDGRVTFVAVSPLGVAEPQFIGEPDNEGTPRAILQTTFVYEVSFAGYDQASPERDLAHKRHCYGLWEATAQILQKKHWGRHQWTGARWEDERKLGRHGAELIATLELSVPLFDVSSESATPSPLPGAPKPPPPPPEEEDP